MADLLNQKIKTSFDKNQDRVLVAGMYAHNPTTGKFDFIISSFSKDCGHYKFDDNYKCNIYKPLISSNLIN